MPKIIFAQIYKSRFAEFKTKLLVDFENLRNSDEQPSASLCARRVVLDISVLFIDFFTFFFPRSIICFNISGQISLNSSCQPNTPPFMQMKANSETD